MNQEVIDLRRASIQFESQIMEDRHFIGWREEKVDVEGGLVFLFDSGAELAEFLANMLLTFRSCSR